MPIPVTLWIRLWRTVASDSAPGLSRFTRRPSAEPPLPPVISSHSTVTKSSKMPTARVGLAPLSTSTPWPGRP